MHRLLWGDDDTNKIGINNVLGGNICGWFYGILNGNWKWKMKQFLVVKWERVPMEIKREKWIKYEYMYYVILKHLYNLICILMFKLE
jgi:hypothetical protein